MEVLYWYWFVLAIVLISIELLMPTMYVVWFGVGALVTGLAKYASPALSLGQQLAILALCSMLLLTVWKIYRNRVKGPENPVPELDGRWQSWVGREFTLSDAIVNGQARVKVEDGRWKVSGEDMPAGTKVIITALEGNTFIVKRV